MMNILKITSPGRINLIGEHTDHQLGFVLPMTINKEISIFIKKRDDSNVKIFSETINQYDAFSLKDIQKSDGWKNYCRGIFKSIHHKFGLSNGCNILIDSSLPMGAGLSSSAALEVGIYTALEELFELDVKDLEVIQDCWNVENNYVGLSCGIMDQFIVRLGKKSYAIKLNCQNLDYSYVKIPKNVQFIVINTGLTHHLSETPYNTRIQECRTALQKLRSNGFNIDNLSQLNVLDTKDIQKILNFTQYKRVQHVVNENDRVRQFVVEINRSLEKAGVLLYNSHLSLKNLFEASWSAADIIVEQCKQIRGVYGARMVGGGWGGSVMIMIEKNQKKTVKEALVQQQRLPISSEHIIDLESGSGVFSNQINFNILDKSKKRFLISEN